MHEQPPPQIQEPAAPRLTLWKRYSLAAQMLALAGFLFLVATNTQSGWIFVIAAAILAVLLVEEIGLFKTLHRHQLEVSLEALPARCGQEAELCLKVRNSSSRPRWGVIVTLPSPPSLPECVSERRFFIKCIPAQGVALVKFTQLCALRGHHLFGQPRVEFSYPWGFVHSHSRVLPAWSGDSGWLQVMPALISEPSDLPAQRRGQTEVSRNRRGQGDELYSLRPYAHGDDMRRVHWPSSAHAGELIVQEFEEQMAQPILYVALDSTQDSELIVPEQPALEGAITLAATILNTFHKLGLSTTFIRIAKGQVIETAGANREWERALTDVQTELNPGSSKALAHWLLPRLQSNPRAQAVYLSTLNCADAAQTPEALLGGRALTVHLLPDLSKARFRLQFQETSEGRERIYRALEASAATKSAQADDAHLPENRFEERSAYIYGTPDTHEIWRWLSARI